MIALSGAALAAGWTLEAGDRVVSETGGSGHAGVLRGGASLELAPRLRLEPALAGGFGPGGALASLGLEARLGPERGLAGLLGAEGAWEGGPGAGLLVGAGWAWAQRDRLEPRAAIRVRYGLGLEPVALLTVGLRRAPAAPEPEPLALVEVETRPPIAPLDADPDDALVFVPHPICSWEPAEGAFETLQQLAPGDPVRVVAPGHLPVEVAVREGPRDDPLPVTLSPAPTQGSVIVVAQPGDEVFVDGHRVPVSEDGLAIVTTREGVHEVAVQGAGRVVELSAAVGDGYASWVRSPPPERLIVEFPVDSSELTAQAGRDIAFYAETVGNWGFELQGSYSPEGDHEHNQRLARARGEQVRRAMVAAGIPEERIEIVPPPEVPEDMATAKQRSCIIVPISRGWAE